jgi:hypothetical protein
MPQAARQDVQEVDLGNEPEEGVVNANQEIGDKEPGEAV